MHDIYIVAQVREHKILETLQIEPMKKYTVKGEKNVKTLYR